MKIRGGLGLLGVGAVIAALTGSSASAQQPEGRADYSRDVRPILSKNCYACHGPDEAQRKAGLRLDRREIAVQKGRSGEAPIVPGKLDESELYQRITADDEASRMPPAGSGHQLT